MAAAPLKSKFLSVSDMIAVMRKLLATVVVTVFATGCEDRSRASEESAFRAPDAVTGEDVAALAAHVKREIRP